VAAVAAAEGAEAVVAVEATEGAEAVVAVSQLHFTTTRVDATNTRRIHSAT